MKRYSLTTSGVMAFCIFACSSGAKQAQRANEPTAPVMRQKQPAQQAEQAKAPPRSEPTAAETPEQTAPEPEPAVDDTPTVTFHTTGGDVIVAVEIADTAALRTRGMMYRESVEPDRGMVFIFANDAIHPFWMKNTYISLDMIHVDSEMRVVGIVENAEPLSLVRRAIEVPSRYVVEVPGGYAKERNILVGESVTFANVPLKPKS